MTEKLQQEIVEAVRSSIVELMEIAEEKWVSEKELIERCSFSAWWIRKHGDQLPRTMLPHTNRWSYPLHKINRLIYEGKLSTL